MDITNIFRFRNSISNEIDLYTRYYQLEKSFLIGDYMKNQTDISEWDRSVIIDWLINVDIEMGLPANVIHHSVKVLDLYLSKTNVKKESLKLIGASVLLLSTKFVSGFNPPLEVFLRLCEGQHTREELVTMRNHIFITIGRSLRIPLTFDFLKWGAMFAQVGDDAILLGRYILELSAMEFATVTIMESKLAAAALFLAMQMLKCEKGWSLQMEICTGYTYQSIEPVVFLLNYILHKESHKELNAIRKKYDLSSNLRLLSNSELRP